MEHSSSVPGQYLDSECGQVHHDEVGGCVEGSWQTGREKGSREGMTSERSKRKKCTMVDTRDGHQSRYSSATHSVWDVRTDDLLVKANNIDDETSVELRNEHNIHRYTRCLEP